ncbi:unnamed protein product [Sphagnum jensenii]|uniref:NAD-dependent epimerase/dehydratase domain-containing protein n=1 Tax=Sphagnum jensenii TaxID=128206 RepID=A0ABP1BQ96_9BRYO
MTDQAAAAGKSKKKDLVCVTGATGFVASWLIKCLLADGYTVRGTVRDPGNEQKTGHLWALPGAKERLELVKADLLTAGSYDEAVSGCDGVFHTATAVVLIESDPQSEMIDPAVFGTLNVLRSCKKSRSVKRVVMTSSSAAVRFNSIFPSAAIPLDETVWSSIWYAVAKTLAEKEAWQFASDNQLDLIVVLPSFVVGPSLPADNSKTVNDVLHLLKGDGSLIGMLGRMGYVHIDDVARAHLLVYQEPSARGRYLCSATELEPEQLCRLVAARYPHLPIPTRLENVPPVPYYTLNSSKLEKLGLKFKPVETMFDDCIACFRNKHML